MRTLAAAFPLIVAVLIGQPAAGAPAAQAETGQSHETVAAKPHPPYPPYPPYPPSNCLRHYERPTTHGWKIELVWRGGRFCPRIFFRPARAEIWMYAGFRPPRLGPWTNDGSAEPAAMYGGHQQTDAEQASSQTAATPATATWWEKMTTVRVNRDGSWSASVHVDEEGPYTFAAVNSITRAFILVEVEVWDDFGGPGGTAGGARAVPAAAAVTGPGKGPGDSLLRVGVPAASSTLVLLLALALALRVRARRARRATTCPARRAMP